MAKDTIIPYTIYEKDEKGNDTDVVLFAGSINATSAAGKSFDEFKTHEAHLKDAGLPEENFKTVYDLAKAAVTQKTEAKAAPAATVAPGIAKENKDPK